MRCLIVLNLPTSCSQYSNNPFFFYLKTSKLTTTKSSPDNYSYTNVRSQVNQPSAPPPFQPTVQISIGTARIHATIFRKPPDQ